ncbi:MAG: TolC family protein [Bacteroidales bacterium]
MAALSTGAFAQEANDESGILAGFFDTSSERTINWSHFHLPPLAVLFENAKQTPSILSMAKKQEMAQAEVTKQKKHIFSYVHGHASYSYGKSDMWGNGSSSYSPIIYQFQGSEQSYWNVGVNVSVPLEDLLDLSHSVKRKRMLVEEAQLQKDIAYDQLKLQIAQLYVNITNNLMALKTAGENAAIYQGASALNELEFQHGNMEIEDFAWTGQRGQAAVNTYQSLLKSITSDILTLEILTHTPIITNTMTEITIESTVERDEKQIAKQNKEIEKRIKEDTEKELKEEEAIKKQEEKQKKEEAKAQEKQKKTKKSK